jgi:hypothetical protein
MIIKLQPKVVGLEVANSFIKLVSDNVSMNDISYPNTVEEIVQSELNKDFNLTPNDIYTYEGKDYLVGQPQFGGSGGKSSNRYKSEQFKREAAFALSNLKIPQGQEIKVVTGLPADDHANKQYQRDIIENLKGDYEVKKGNITRRFTITDVAVIPQPMGTLLSYAFTRSLMQRIPDEEIMKDWNIIDGGGGTTDVIPVSINGIGNPFTLYEGMNDVHTALMAKFNETYPDANLRRRVKSIYQFDEMIKDKDEIKLGGKIYSVKDMKTMLYEQFVQRLYKQLTNSGFDVEILNNLLTGGGGKAMYGSYKSVFKDCEINLVSNPQIANAEGFYIYGKKKWS